jgi:hypothetical protein
MPSRCIPTVVEGAVSLAIRLLFLTIEIFQFVVKRQGGLLAHYSTFPFP